MLNFEEWRGRLRESCGHYYAKPAAVRARTEQFDLRQVQGLDKALIRCAVDRIERTRQGIRRDDAEHFFLLHQAEGEMAVRHCDCDVVLQKGDFLLLDSTRPAELIFGGNVSQFTSVHMPRTLFLAGREHTPATGIKVTTRNPLHASLTNLISDQSDGVDVDQFCPDDFFDFVAMVFGPDPASVNIGQFRNRGGRMRYISQIIDQHLQDQDFSIDDLAVRVGRSRRQLQRDFYGSGTSFTEVLKTRRLHHFVAAGRRLKRQGYEIGITDLAYMSGFSDPSHFNRMFREAYQTSPREFFRKTHKHMI
ncbi:helix-turn-helix domain-containing protein [Pukyongiella litopenaei]|uniref:Helix-turn-helix domain-containing protein n=1 Tax=Pukyongiella litopenaei TaxID=2605946 RepID=A0A2S0MQU5_9RHOB|nr:helix-turn-helix domain-containing protein [Pukyongiella litopenaei]AVO38244.1 helix-turn-helix domain-containing protein [Pukyongiella litopenaei]